MIKFEQQSVQNGGNILVKYAAVTSGMVFVSLCLILTLFSAGVANAVKTKPTSQSQIVISDTRFGIHSFFDKPGVSAGTMRMNCHPTWEQMNPSRGVFSWTEMDAYLSKVETWGYKDILFTICGTPAWAATKPNDPTKIPYFGEQGASPPAMSYWKQFVTSFIKRYGKRLDAIEVWNEATSLWQWQGTPKQMAQMTNIVYKIARKEAPHLKIVSANIQTGQPGWVDRFMPEYARELAKLGWPIDVIAFHTYSGADLTQRTSMLKYVHRLLKTHKVPQNIPVWDTEVNYIGSFTDTQSATRVARTFLDSWRYNIERTYWYVWTSLGSTNTWGIPTEPNSAATLAYNTIVSWTLNSRMQKCVEKTNSVSCNFTRGRKSFSIAWAKTEGTTAEVTANRKQTMVCQLQSSTKCSKNPTKKVLVNSTPTLIK